MHYQVDLKQAGKYKFLLVYIPRLRSKTEAEAMLEYLVEKLVKARVSASQNLVVVYEPCKWSKWTAVRLVQYLSELS